MGRVYMIADTHFCHKNAIRFRKQFDCMEEHDCFIVDRWNEVVTKNDLVYVLGDLSFSKDQEYLDLLRENLNGDIKLIRGNHDLLTPKNIKVTLPLVSYKGYWLSHAPIHPMELRGKKNIHGHTHSFKIPDNNYIGVSCEQIDYQPILFDDIKRGTEKIMRRKV